jgi:NAD(P)-dependent dehydrogenase (short-subunit alcohol dehydrogenase family)
MNDKQPVLLVTGGSRGIGAAVCISAARQGWAVVVNYASNKPAADSVVRAIRDAGGEAYAAEGDVGTTEGIASIFAAVDKQFGRLDGLVNNAGVVDTPQRIDEMSPERLDRMFRINVRGSILCAAEAVRRMSTRHGGRGGVIVNISSMAATIAREVATESVRVNAVRPGIVDTEIHASGGVPDRVRDMSPLVPLRRAGTAQEIADAVLYLLSPSASYITGAILNVSGGR